MFFEGPSLFDGARGICLVALLFAAPWIVLGCVYIYKGEETPHEARVRIMREAVEEEKVRQDLLKHYTQHEFRL